MLCLLLEDAMIDGVHIWRAALDEAGWPGAERLPAAERERATAFLREEACRRWVAARWALRRVLGSYLDEPAAEIKLVEGERGKPRLGEGNRIQFNLSHSSGLALVAVTEGRAVGVDVELIEPRRDLAGLAERALEPDEAAAVREATPARQATVFYSAWVRHEARLKCLGTGLAAKTNRRFSTPEGENRRLANEDGLLAVSELDVAPGYAAAVAVAAAEVGPIDCRSLRAG
ncbi:MAG: 4'-phosphopantetheinyl transferase family protein [Solirubrobacterales bacterium]